MKFCSLFLATQFVIGCLLNSPFVNDKKSEPKKVYSYENAGVKYDLSLSEISCICQAEFTSFSEDRFDPLSSQVIHDFAGNDYLLNTFYPSGYSVVSLSNLETLEVNYFDNYDFTKIDFEKLYYFPLNGFWLEEENFYRNIYTNIEIPLSGKKKIERSKSFEAINSQDLIKNNISRKISYLSMGPSGDASFNHSLSSGEISATYEVDYSWFFKYNTTQFSYADERFDGIPLSDCNGLCEYVALLMLIEYNDFFKNGNYFFNEEVTYYMSTNNSSNYKCSIPTVSDNFVFHLYIENDRETNLTLSQLNSLCDYFMINKNASYHYETAGWLGWNVKNKIRDDKIPIMLCGIYPDGLGGNKAHCIIAYGAFSDSSSQYDGKLLVHYGWDDYSQCIVSKSVITELYEWRLVDDYTGSHIHRNIFSVNNVLCCGKELPS